VSPDYEANRVRISSRTIELAGDVLACALYATRVERYVRTGGDGRELDRLQVGGGPGAIDLFLDGVCRTTG
jgi:hypothetical protein